MADDSNFKETIETMDKVRLVFPDEVENLTRDFQTSLGIQRTIQDIVNRHYHFITKLRADGLLMAEIAHVLTRLMQEMGFDTKICKKTLHSALFRVQNRLGLSEKLRLQKIEHLPKQLQANAQDCSPPLEC
ncbi:MAG: hypothetical protein ACRCT6_12790, partial [Notoacmeibacter sp.]